MEENLKKVELTAIRTMYAKESGGWEGEKKKKQKKKQFPLWPVVTMLLEHLKNLAPKCFYLRDLLFYCFPLKVTVDMYFFQKWLTKNKINFSVVCINYGQHEMGG